MFRGCRAAWTALLLLALLFPGAVFAGGPATAPEYRPFERGDVTGDGVYALDDALELLAYLFQGGAEPGCLDACDLNDDEDLTLVDPLQLLDFMFTGGAPPPAPFGDCGPDPTLNVALTCTEYEHCGDLTDVDQAAHVMRRTGFGPTPDGIANIMNIGATAYIDQQLDHESIDESGNTILNQLLGGLSPSSDIVDLIWLQVIRQQHSERQLHEAMTEFWENHFTTDLAKVLNLIQMINVMGVPVFPGDLAVQEAVLWEYQENEKLRDGALGSFFDLLEASATGKPMLVYLDGIYNIVGNPNENYGRELFELHTMGVDNGYLQEDIEEVSRCFTGWTICKTPVAEEDDPHGTCLPFDSDMGVWTFHFHPPFHDYAPKILFPGTSYQLVIPTRPPGSTEGILDGYEVLAHLATLPQTAEFVSTKLVRRFVDDEAPPALVAECVTTWLATDGDIKDVVATILHSDEFLDAQHRWNKVMTPIEFLAAQPRVVGAPTSGLPIIFGVDPNPYTGLVGLNYIPFLFETPDGRSEFGFDWMASTHLLNRILYSTLLAESTIDPEFNPIAIMNANGVTPGEVEEIVDFWLFRIYQNHYTLAERDLAIQFLSTGTSGNPFPLNPGSPQYESRIRDAIGYILAAPQGQKQ